MPPPPPFEHALSLQRAGRLTDAATAYRAILLRDPHHLPSLVNLAVALTDLADFPGAIPLAERAISLSPATWEAHNILGSAHRELGQLDAALAAYREALSLAPDNAALWSNFATALKDTARLDDALAAYRRALELDPNNAPAHSNLLFCLMYHPGTTADDIKAEAERFDARFARPLSTTVRPFLNDQDPERRLRVGYVSADFRDHCQSFFTVPLFEHLDPKKHEVHLYATLAREDEVTARLRRSARAWHDISALSDADAATLIRRHGVDVLVDLTMHMAGNRLTLFARKPAPVQITWLAYPGTTGLRSINYRLTDPNLDPPPVPPVYSEESLPLPCTFWCYNPLTSEPVPNPLPALANGHVTFGCLNNFCKVNADVASAWIEILRQIPGSKLLILSPEGSHRLGLLAAFSDGNVDPTRISFSSPRPRPDYLRLYHQIDLALDTWPYNGHTTSLDACWMGVPVVTRIGHTVVGRAGLSQLTNLGLADLIAEDTSSFVQIATGLASNLPLLSDLRRTLRTRLEASPLMDAPRFARGMEAAYRSSWRRWCSA